MSADAARDRRDWLAAADGYRAVVRIQPRNAGWWVQLGHALKESGGLQAAGDAYRRALSIDRFNADTHLQHGHLLKMQDDRGGAVAAYAQALRLDPMLDSALGELVHLGARDHIPAAVIDRQAMWRRLDRVAEALAEANDVLRAWIGTSAYPMAAYDRFRSDIAVRPPPPLATSLDDPTAPMMLAIDCRTATATAVRATLTALLDQSDRCWEARLVEASGIASHPVASMLVTDMRIGFEDAGTYAQRPGLLISIDAGVILHPHALAWLRYAAARSGAAAVTCDHDRARRHWARGQRHAEPVLYGVDDAFLRAAVPPPLVAMRGDAVPRLGDCAGISGACLRTGMTDAARTVRSPVVHVPRILASMLDDGVERPIVPGSRAGPPASPSASRSASPGPPGPLAARRSRIAIVMPTRDEAAMLVGAVDSLLAMADLPDRIIVIIVDNRSQEPATHAVLRARAARSDHAVVTMDEPFNWSRANMLGIADPLAADCDLLVFANNDVVMLTQGWDRALEQQLHDPQVGIVGARLLYPDMTVQHAGIVMGAGEGLPLHEGRHAAFDDPGPGARYVTQHDAAAVTGAFLAMRRDVLAQIGGFECVRLPIAYNDIDVCLRARAAGYRVRYCPQIELIHDESKTRGRSRTADEMAWDDAELADIYARWGEALTIDPGLNPQWALGGAPFDGLREPGPSEILAFIDRSGRVDPWRVTPASL
ncbi:glycosyltransferase [Sphingomonas sp. LB3N6]|uniref:glycosyltransferase n=1 Tax=Sphingomonas fucosidasi TaxID=3096164 RepID=UPI002FC62AB7